MELSKELKKYTNQKKILIVEDSIVNQKIYVSLLEDFCKVRVANNGKEGLELFQKEFFDLVISDIEMPVMNGVEMAKAIKKLKKEQAIIVISSQEETNTFINLIDIGVDGFLLKPISHDKFYEKILEALKNKYYKQEIEKVKFVEYLDKKQENLFQNCKKCTLKYNDSAKYIDDFYVKKYSVDYKDIKNEGWDLFSYEEEDIIFLCNEFENYINEMIFNQMSELNLKYIIELLRKISNMLSIIEIFQNLSKSFERLSTILEEHIIDVYDDNKKDAFQLLEYIWFDIEKYMYAMFINRNIKDLEQFIKSLDSNISNLEFAFKLDEEVEDSEDDLEFF